jgi:hypothetical protein
MGQIYSIDIKVAKDGGGNDVLTLSKPSVAMKVDDYITWSADFAQMNVVRIDTTSCPFPGGGPWNQDWDKNAGACYPCPAVPVTLKGTFRYSVCACVRAAPNNKSLVAQGEIDVS